MKNHHFTSSSPQTKDDNNKVEKKKNELMQHLLHHDTETSINNNPTTKTRRRYGPNEWVHEQTRKEQQQLSDMINAQKKHPFPPRTSAQLPKPRYNNEFRRGEEVFREKKQGREMEGSRRERAERRRELRDQSSSLTTMSPQSSSWKTTATKMKTETRTTTAFTTTSEEGDTTNVDLGAEWQDILNQHAPLREYVRKRAREEKKESIFSTRGENDMSTTNNEAFAFAKEELRMLRKRFIEGDDDDITESIVVALQFDIDAGGLLDQFERERLKRIRAMENGKRNASVGGRTARIGIARVEYLSFPKDDERDDFDENYLFDIASRRIKDSFYAHGGGTAVLKDLEHSGNGARIETPRPPFGNFPIINENDDIDADDGDSDRSSNSARSDADEEENTNEEKKQRVNIQGAFAALGLQFIISFVSPKVASKEIRKEATTQTAQPPRNTKKESSSFKKRSRSVYVTNTGSEDITLVALRIVDAKNINDDEPENITTININSSSDKNKDPRYPTGSSSFSSSVFSLRDDYNVSSSKYHHRTIRREKNNSKSRKRPIVRIPTGGVYQATIDCTIDSETKRAHVTSWIIAIFGTKKNELRACATQCSVLITGSNVFNEPTHVSLLSEEATPFIPESMRRAFDHKAQEYYPPSRSYLDIIWGRVGRYFLSIENRNILPAPADYYDSKLPTWLFTYQFNRTMILDPNSKFFFESKNHAPWTKSLEWASVFRDFSSYSSSSSSEKESFEKIRLKSARLLYIEEAQQNKDVKRYDMFNRTIRPLGARSEQNELLVYSLEVPGLQNGYPPIVVGDVVRCRVNAKAHQKELSPFLEYAFRIIAIVSKTQTVHLQAPWTDGTLNMSPQLTAKNGMTRTSYPQNGQQQQRQQQQQHERYNGNEIERLQCGINEEQYEFVMRCRRKREQLSLEGINSNNNANNNIKERTVAPLVCFGPPGTGKTLTIAHAVLDALSINPDARILVCAPAPFAADVILDRIVREHPKYFRNTTASTNVYCRIDDPRRAMSEKMGSITPFSVDVRDWFASKTVKYGELEHSARVLVCSCVSAGILYEALKTMYKARANINYEIDGPLYQEVNFAFRSFFEVSESYEREGRRRRPGLTHLFIDEAAQATIPEVLIQMSLVNEQTLVVMSGDSKQLGPLVHSKVAIRGGLEKSLLETCVDMMKRSTASDDTNENENLITLTKNYRSHPDILAIASESFYDGKLETFASKKDVRKPEDEIFEHLKLKTMQQNKNSNEEDGATNHQCPRRYRNIFVAVEGLEKVEVTKSQSQVETKSFSNALECEKVCEIISALLSATDTNDAKNRIAPADIEVIAVYRRQVLALRQVLRQINLGAIRVGTIDDYQGQEAKVIIISTVASTGPSEFRRRRNGEEGFGEEEAKHTILSDPKRFNVATSRAKALNIIVGHPKLRLFPNWSRLIRKISQNGGSSVGDMSSTTGKTTMTTSNKPPPPSDGNNSDNNYTQFFVDEYASIEEDLEKEKTKMMSVFDDDDLPWRVQL
ncbi:unnamed protein product [Bathycoccus prasinos]